jgi:NADH dehydrogenase
MVAMAVGAVVSTLGVRPADIDRSLPAPVREAIRWSWSIFALIGAVTTPGERTMQSNRRQHVVVVGGGYAGLQAVRSLCRAPVDVTLIDRRNFHLFQPLLYQVATGALSAGEIATPLRSILKRQKNARVVLGEVSGFDLDGKRVLLGRTANGDSGAAIPYDTLIVAAGATHAYFGHDEWRPFAPGLKSLEDAVEIRRRILAAFEAAEVEQDPDTRRALLTFVVVGGGPTGVEVAGQIAEVAHDTLSHDFRTIDPRTARILLVESSDRLLAAFPEQLSARAARSLNGMGVTPLLRRPVVALDQHSVTVQGADGPPERIPARTVIWAAGVRASGLAGALAEATGAALDGAGRVAVGPDLTLPGHPDVFALGDMASVHDAAGRPLRLPGVAPTAMQEGRYAAKVIRRRLAGKEHRPFRYFDKGNVATIGRLRAVADIKGVHLSGALAWFAYVFVHLFYLVGLQNRFLVMTRWTVSFVTRGRGSRLITGSTTPPDATHPVPRDQPLAAAAQPGMEQARRNGRTAPAELTRA